MVEKAKKEKRRKILVTGSSGMLGVDLCDELEKNYEVIGLDVIKRPETREQRTEFIHCDITQRDKTIKSIVDAKPDIIIHAAAWTDVDGCERESAKARKINEEGTENVALSASKLDIPLIYTSTDFVFDGEKKTPYTEEDQPNPINVYAKSKLEGEKKAGVLNKYIILRSSWLYGTNGRNFVDTILKKAKAEKKLKVVNDQVGCPTYTKDLAKAISRLLTMGTGLIIGHSDMKRPVPIREIYHISNKGCVSWFDYAREILRLAGITGVTLIPITSEELGRPAKRPQFSVLDNDKFESETGFVMRQWQEALREYLVSRLAAGKPVSQ